MVSHIRIQLGKILSKRPNRNNSAVKLGSDGEQRGSTGRPLQTAWQTAVSRSNNNPQSQ